jgi:putative ABC transport system permease protein
MSGTKRGSDAAPQGEKGRLSSSLHRFGPSSLLLPRLSFAHLRTHKVRVALTLAAIAFSVSLVVAVTSGYASTSAAAHKLLGIYLSGTDATISRAGGGAAFSQNWTRRVAADRAVRRADGRLESQSGLLDDQGEAAPGGLVRVVGVRLPGDERIESLRLEAGHWFKRSDELSVVLDQVLAEKLEVKVEDFIYLPGVDKKLKLKVVGIVHKPEALAMHLRRTLYVPLETLQRFTGQAGRISEIEIQLKPGADAAAFARRWHKRLADQTPPLKLTLASDRQRSMDQQLGTLELLSYLGGAVSMLAAAFIIFSALSMGVSERIRSLAMLRAIGAYRGQIGRLVLIEGTLLALIGALIGVPLGILWVQWLASVHAFAAFFSAGVAVSWGGVAFGVGGSVIAAVLASLLPAIQAMRVSPLEAMASAAAPARPLSTWVCALVGLLLICIDPLLLWGPLPHLLRLLGSAAPQDAARNLRFYLHLGIGLPAIVIGFFLLAPLFIRVTEAVLGRVVAAGLGLRFSLLRQQLSGGIWRSAGTAAALMVGMATLVAMQTQGTSLLAGWQLPDKFPDVFVLSPLSGLSPQDIGKIDQIQGLKQVMPVALASPQLGSGIGGLMAVAIPDATLFFGVPTDQAFDMVDLDFRQGNPAEAKRLLKQGRHILITAEFAKLKHIGVGGSFPLKTTHGIVDYKVAGVVWSPGMDVIVSLFDLGGQLQQRTASCVFGTLADARRDFGVSEVHLLAANLDTTNAAHGITKDELVDRIQKAVGAWGLKVGDVRKIKHDILSGFQTLLLLCSTIAFAAMGVAALGVTNTIMAAVRSRQWQFGILRGIGLTRWQLLRLVLAEALLLAITGCAMGLAAGLEVALDAKAFTVSTLGYNPPLVVPWGMIGIGAGIVVVLALLAALWPAISTALSQPLTLLQAGRASG